MKKRVLILCTGNSARSQMAEAFLRHRAGDRFEVYSAGLHPRPVDPLTVEVMQEVGIDIRAQRSKGIRDLKDVGSFLFVIIVCSKAEAGCPETFAPSAVRLLWPFEDPSAVRGSRAARLRAFRDVRDQISTRIQSWVNDEVPPSWLCRNQTRKDYE